MGGVRLRSQIIEASDFSDGFTIQVKIKLILCLTFHLYHSCAFIHCDLPTAIQIVHLESPLQLIRWSSLLRQVDGRHEFTEIQLSVRVGVKRSEYVVGKLIGKVIDFIISWV